MPLGLAAFALAAQEGRRKLLDWHRIVRSPARMDEEQARVASILADVAVPSVSYQAININADSIFEERGHGLTMVPRLGQYVMALATAFG